MKRINYYTMAVTLGLICLFFIEGMLTLGSAFQFEHYTVAGWIGQGVMTLFTVSLSINIAYNNEKE